MPTDEAQAMAFGTAPWRGAQVSASQHRAAHSQQTLLRTGRAWTDARGSGCETSPREPQPGAPSAKRCKHATEKEQSAAAARRKKCYCDGGIKKLRQRRGRRCDCVADATDLLNAEVAAAMALLAESTAPAEPPYDE